MAEAAKWYVAHTYSGYENAVKTTIEKYVTKPASGGSDPRSEDPHGNGHGNHGQRHEGDRTQGIPRLCPDQNGDDR